MSTDAKGSFMHEKQLNSLVCDITNRRKVLSCTLFRCPHQSDAAISYVPSEFPLTCASQPPLYGILPREFVSGECLFGLNSVLLAPCVRLGMQQKIGTLTTKEFKSPRVKGKKRQTRAEMKGRGGHPPTHGRRLASLPVNRQATLSQSQCSTPRIDTQVHSFQTHFVPRTRSCQDDGRMDRSNPGVTCHYLLQGERDEEQREEELVWGGQPNQSGQM